MAKVPRQCDENVAEYSASEGRTQCQAEKAGRHETRVRPVSEGRRGVPRQRTDLAQDLQAHHHRCLHPTAAGLQRARAAKAFRIFSDDKIRCCCREGADAARMS